MTSDDLKNGSSDLYNTAFYEDQATESLMSARTVLPELFRYHPAESVVDIGCGVGSWLRAAMENGATRGLGVDGDYVSPEQLLVGRDLFLPADLSAPGLGSVVAGRTAEARFDLAICLEVAEHLPFARSESFVEDLTGLSDVVLFSAAVPYQYGTGHINEQWPEFWALLFRRQGYLCFDFLRDRFWSSSDVKWWYAQNILVFVREDSEVFSRFSEETSDGPLARIHPSAWLASILYHWRPHRAAAAGLEEQDFDALTAAWASGRSDLPALKTVAHSSDDYETDPAAFPFTRTVLDSPETRISGTENTLTVAKETIGSLENALSEARRTTQESRAREESIKAECAEKTSENGLLSAANASLHVQVQRYIGELSVIGELRRELDQKTRECREISAANVELESGMKRRAREEMAVRDEFEKLSEGYNQIRKSTSWRVTFPLRVVRRLFGR
ncbi:class I SAM-dependent methyltransferase [Acetobacter oeni]|uniref:Uncharacterized protein n=1 Tax=Acetobacter oeni TaxID=304077 RepID=A0A511XNU9_9PROT|nr:class I SAM-dependent methyltransferase [Acetobacter oeni]MBB3881630.1 SAM-dependent methyltransferase [Acetobacter oeni]NHO17560.1 hypothetical protein [Acetobacter oeni]GEN64615.1 hypothetical protein AOE01nite_28390 [Acetobacter oeni]